MINDLEQFKKRVSEIEKQHNKTHDTELSLGVAALIAVISFGIAFAVAYQYTKDKQTANPGQVISKTECQEILGKGKK